MDAWFTWCIVAEVKKTNPPWMTDSWHLMCAPTLAEQSSSIGSTRTEGKTNTVKQHPTLGCTPSKQIDINKWTFYMRTKQHWSNRCYKDGYVTAKMSELSKKGRYAPACQIHRTSATKGWWEICIWCYHLISAHDKTKREIERTRRGWNACIKPYADRWKLVGQMSK